MNRDERLDLRERTAASAAAHRREIERRQAERENDPIAFDNWLRAEPIGAPLMQKSDDAADLMYRTIAHATPAPAAADGEASDGSPYPSFETLVDSLAEHTMALILRERVTYDRRIAKLE